MKIKGLSEMSERSLNGSYVVERDRTKYKARLRVLTSKKDIDKEGFTNVYVEVEIYHRIHGFDGRKRIFRRYPTGVRVQPENWDKKNGYIKRGLNSGFSDHKIKQHLLRVQSYLNELQAGERVQLPVELEELYQFFGQEKTAKNVSKTVLDYLDEYIRYRQAKSKKRGSWKEFLTLRNRLEKYQSWKKQVLSFQDMTVQFSFELEQWMRKIAYNEKKKVLDGKNDTVLQFYDSNTIKKTFVTLKTFLNHYLDLKDELDEKIHLTNSFRNEKFGHITDASEAPPLPLTNENFEKLWASNEKVESDKHLSKIRLLVLLQCSVGCRVSDLFKLGSGKNRITDEAIVYYPTKTETRKKGYKNEIVVPLNKYSRYVLEKSNYDLSKLKMTDQHYNRSIKTLFLHLGIDDELTEYEVYGRDGSGTYKKYEVFTSHNCRDTFITFCIEKNIPVPIIMDWVGQTSYEVMKKYFKPDPKKKLEYMNLWN